MKLSHVFISGGATGMGRAAVEQLVRENVKVSFLDLNKEAGEELVRDLGKEHVFFSHGNASVLKDMQRSVQGAVDVFGAFQGVFSCAGVHHSGNILSCDEEDFDRMVTANLKSTFFCVQTCLPHLIEQGGGSVVLMGSDQVFVGKPGSFLYGMTKGAIGQMTKSLAVDWAGKNVRVNAVCPGTIDTPMAQKAIARWAQNDFGGDVSHAWDEEAKFFPLGRVGQPEEVARLVLFLLQPENSFITGSCYKIEGGLTAG